MYENEKHMRMMEIYDSISHVFFDVTIIQDTRVKCFCPNILFKHLITIFGAS